MYEHFLIASDFNSQITESAAEDFCETYRLHNSIKDRLHNSIKDPICLKKPDKPSYIDLIQTNFPKSFVKSQTLETGSSDSHKLTFAVLKIHHEKQKPVTVKYRD